MWVSSVHRTMKSWNSGHSTVIWSQISLAINRSCTVVRRSRSASTFPSAKINHLRYGMIPRIYKRSSTQAQFGQLRWMQATMISLLDAQMARLEYSLLIPHERRPQLILKTLNVLPNSRTRKDRKDSPQKNLRRCQMWMIWVNSWGKRTVNSRYLRTEVSLKHTFGSKQIKSGIKSEKSSHVNL